MYIDGERTLGVNALEPKVALLKADLLRSYRLMALSRALDRKMLIMLRQGKSFFHIGCMGHEAIQAAAALALDPARDFLFPYYRDQTLCLGMGMTPLDCLLGFLAREGDPSSGGRQMPQHFGSAKCNIVTSSSSTGTQFLQAVGNAFASVREWKERHPNGRDAHSNLDLPVSLVCAGDGTTSQGDFHEALSWAAREKAPIVFLIEDNGYAISVPISEQRPGGKVAPLGRGYDGLETIEVDGLDFFASFGVMRAAVSRARKGLGPSFIDAHVVRLLPHSSSDDDKKYRSEKELKAELVKDPLPRMRHWLLQDHGISERELLAVDKSVSEEVEEAADNAEKAPEPSRAFATKYVFSARPEPKEIRPSITDDVPETVLVDAVNRALAEELTHNPRVMIFGQDVAGQKGGVFTATRGLTAAFGKDRCFNAPLAESSIVGVGIGLAMRGFKPVVEIQFGDYIWTAMMQLRNELATIRYRSNDAFKAPMVIRVPVGGYIHGGLCHSQNIEATFAHFPGIKIALPSTALDAYGLLKEAIRCDDPVLFLEHKALYRQNFAKSRLPGDVDWTLPFGKALVRRAGKHVTVVTYGILVYRALDVARELEKEGISVEVIDLRTIRPYDRELVSASVRKTSRVLVLHEDCRFMGFGAEIAAEIAEFDFAHLDAPVRRLAGQDTPVPYAPSLEEEVLPQNKKIADAIRDLARY
jgi:2-oxoisovalerate dehydrogenase E1 component